MTGRTVPRRPATAMFVYSRDSFRFAVEEAVSSRRGFFITKVPSQISPQNAPWATLLEHTELSFVGLLGTGIYWTQLEEGKGSALMIALVNLRLPCRTSSLVCAFQEAGFSSPASSTKAQCPY